MKKTIILLLAVFLSLSVACYASSVEVQDDGTRVGVAMKLNFTGSTVTFSGDTATIPLAEGASIERVIQFQPSSFINQDTSPAPVTSSTTPGLEIDNLLTSLVWADGETTASQVMFKVPADYSSGGAFRLLCDESGDTTRNQVDFSVYVNTTGSAWDAAATDQTPVAMTSVAGTSETVTLTVATDFASLAAGQFVGLNLWRDNTATGTNDLELYYAEFYYTANE